MKACLEKGTEPVGFLLCGMMEVKGQIRGIH